MSVVCQDRATSVSFDANVCCIVKLELPSEKYFWMKKRQKPAVFTNCQRNLDNQIMSSFIVQEVNIQMKIYWTF